MQFATLTVLVVWRAGLSLEDALMNYVCQYSFFGFTSSRILSCIKIIHIKSYILTAYESCKADLWSWRLPWQRFLLLEMLYLSAERMNWYFVFNVHVGLRFGLIVQVNTVSYHLYLISHNKATPRSIQWSGFWVVLRSTHAMYVRSVLLGFL